MVVVHRGVRSPAMHENPAHVSPAKMRRSTCGGEWWDDKLNDPTSAPKCFEPLEARGDSWSENMGDQ